MKPLDHPDIRSATTLIAQVGLGDGEPNAIGRAVADHGIAAFHRIIDALAAEGWHGIMFRSLTGPMQPRDGKYLKWTCVVDLLNMGIDAYRLAEYHLSAFGIAPRVWIGGATLAPARVSRVPSLSHALSNAWNWHAMGWAVGYDAAKAVLGEVDPDAFRSFLASSPAGTWAEDCGEYIDVPHVESIRTTRHDVMLSDHSHRISVSNDESCSVAFLKGDWPDALIESVAYVKRTLVVNPDDRMLRSAVRGLG
jgi:hypothetical protein